MAIENKLTSPAFTLKLDAYQKALKQLTKALNEPFSEYIRDACIQRFEFSYELAWKTLKVYLAEQGIFVQSPKETLKASFTQGLIHDADAWSELQLNRNLSAHTYNEHLANDVYAFLKKDGLKLFQDLDKVLDTKR